MTKSKSLGLLLLHSKGNFYQFNLLTQENQATFCQHINFLLHFLSVLLRTIGSTLKNPLNFSKRLLFLLRNGQRKKKHVKEQHCVMIMDKFKGQCSNILKDQHCLKSVLIQTRKNSVFGHFSRRKMLFHYKYTNKFQPLDTR